MADYDVTTANASLEFDTTNGTYNNCFQIDDNHFINFWAGSGDDGYVQVFAVDTSTWAVTTANASLEFDISNGIFNNCFAIDSNHFINFWGGYLGDGYTQVFTVNTTTWAVTTANASLEFDTADGNYHSCYAIDDNHFINFWAGVDSDGFVQTFTVDTSTWAVTTAADRLEFDTVYGRYNSCYAIDATHFINFWGDPGTYKGYTQVFAVNTTTWAVTTAGAKKTFDNGGFGWNNNCYQIDANHFINFWAELDVKGYTQVLAVNTTTWAVTTAGAVKYFAAERNFPASCKAIDSNHFILFWASTDDDGFAQVFTVDTSTWAVTTAAASLEFDATNGTYNSCYAIDSNHFINFWAGTDVDGFAQVFTVALPSVAAGNPYYAYAQM